MSKLDEIAARLRAEDCCGHSDLEQGHCFACFDTGHAHDPADGCAKGDIAALLLVARKLEKAIDSASAREGAYRNLLHNAELQDILDELEERK